MSIPVSFTDNSSPGPSGPIVAWAWDFGDGSTSTSENPVHNYTSAGNYSVRLVVTGSGEDGTAGTTKNITVVAEPSGLNSAFTYSVSGLAVTFTDASTAGSSGPITSRHWDFGDGNTSSSTNPSHTYTSNGTYTVVLTVTGTSPDGTDTASHSIPVSSGGTTFLTETSFARPAFTQSRTVNFSTKAQLDAAIANMQAGDLIKYNGTGVLSISNSSGNAYILANKNPSTAVVIDFGCSHNIWDTSKITGNYVKFSYTGSGNVEAFYMHDCSNIRIYGGEMNSGIGGAAIRLRGQNSNLYLWDQYVSQAGSHGLQIQPADPSSGAARTINNCSFRVEVNRFCMNPSTDPHADKGTGYHGCLFQDTNYGTISNSTVIIYAHDSLRPGESSAGKTWPEGGGGSGIEIGTQGGSHSNNTFYILVRNMLMKCTGTNPGSGGSKQTGGNGINWWGAVSLNNDEVPWIECDNITGQNSHGTGGGWHPGSPPIVVSHGRSTNTNQGYPYNNLSSSTDPYDRRWGIVYNDCT